jgi:hypothetical protein
MGGQSSADLPDIFVQSRILVNTVLGPDGFVRFLPHADFSLFGDQHELPFSGDRVYGTGDGENSQKKT